MLMGDTYSRGSGAGGLNGRGEWGGCGEGVGSGIDSNVAAFDCRLLVVFISSFKAMNLDKLTEMIYFEAYLTAAGSLFV